MSLTAGDKLGPYEVVALIGKGGMGEVYRARDTKLKRDVAVKVLPDIFLAEPERRLRFQREAEVLASLNHPNIATIHGLVETNGTQALVLALVEGPTLDERIIAGPLPMDEAVSIAQQIIAALEYAHERSVIHRDLKPANVKIPADGSVKVLDFGLAKVLDEEQSAVSGVESPTLTLGHTRAGVILGTAAYMSPEQAVGKTADRRSDIFSFGAVLYEMLTGRRAFSGDSGPEILISVAKDEPDWSKLPAATPRAVREVLRRCLTKDRKQRMQAIGEARILLENAGREEPAAATTPVPKRGWMWAAIAGVFAALSVLLGLVAWKHAREEPPHVVRFTFPPPGNTSFPPNLPTMSVSPDGRRVAFETLAGGKRALWVRDLEDPTPRMLAELPSIPELPFWAPDSRRLAFFDGGKLKKIDVTGGPAVTIADTGAILPGSGSWNADDVIVFGTTSTAISRVSAAGGSAAPVTELNKASGETAHWAPWFLPDGRHFLYLAVSADPEKSRVYVGDLSSKTRKPAVAFGTRAIYADPGYLLFVRDRTLMAQPFSPSKLETTGDAVPLAEQIDTLFSAGVALGHFSASRNGVLMYTSGGATATTQLTWFDRTGKKLDTAGAPGELEWFSLSPDGEAIALTRRDPQTGHFDLWTWNLAHQSESRLTFMGNNRFPVWSADGTRIFFMSDGDGGYKIYQKAANGTGSTEMVDGANRAPIDSSRDGRYLFSITSNANSKTSNDIWVTPLFGDRKPFAYVSTEFHEVSPRISPDGHWLAYQSDESKQREIYVVSFPQPGGKWQISAGGGFDPVWSRDGRELYYYSPDNKIMAVPIQPGPQFQFGIPKALFGVTISLNNISFAVSQDGRFLLPAVVEQAASAPMTVVLNWPEGLKK